MIFTSSAKFLSLVGFTEPDILQTLNVFSSSLTRLSMVLLTALSAILSFLLKN